MNLYIKDKSFTTQYVIDMFSSLIWTRRYYEYGDFELYLPANADMFNVFKIGYYIVREDDDTVMIVEKIEIVTDADNGNYITISGRSLESIFCRRIVWSQTNVSGSSEAKIRSLINSSCINPTDTKRIIPGLILGEEKGYTSEDETLTQYTGDILYDIISDLCKTDNLGFKVSLNETILTFDIYKGNDFSYAQNENPWVVFSPNFDNLIKSDYYSDKTNYVNIAHVLGEGEGTARLGVSYGTTKTGFDRYETFVDARDISRNKGSEDEISVSDYYRLLTQRGREKLAESGITTGFSGEISSIGTYKYKEDYNVGDIIQIENKYGFNLSTRIIEMIESWDENGYTLTPTFQKESEE